MEPFCAYHNGQGCTIGGDCRSLHNCPLEIKSADQEAEDSARMLAVCAVIISMLGMGGILVWAAL